jgi:hypothetical protein
MALATTHGLWAGLTAAVAVMASPAAAAQLPRSEAPPLAASISQFSQFPSSRFDVQSDLNEWGCWGCGWGGGWRGGGWRGGGWRRRGPSAGEVLAGVAIVGGIAAIAAAASNNRRNRDVVIVDRDRPRDWERRDERVRYDDRRPNPRSGGAGGLDAAVNQCLATVERDVRVNDVETVQRTAQGWLVAGSLFNGSGFECRIGNDGRIEAIDYGVGGGFGAATGTQWDDARYADARRSMDPSLPDRGGAMMAVDPSAVQADPAALATLAANGAEPLVPLTAARLPAYPGGPVEGEELPPVVERPGIP